MLEFYRVLLEVQGDVAVGDHAGLFFYLLVVVPRRPCP